MLLGPPRSRLQRHWAGLDANCFEPWSGNGPLCVRAGQHLLPALLGAGADKAALRLLGSMADLYSSHSRDAGDTLMLAFQAGNYTQVGGLVLMDEGLWIRAYGLEISFSGTPPHLLGGALGAQHTGIIPVKHAGIWPVTSDTIFNTYEIH